MKIKRGFVTNSSSTSFVAWGVSYSESELKNLISGFLYEKVNDEYENVQNYLESTEFTDEVYDLCNKIDLNFSHNYDSDILYIGVSPFNMKDEQTLEDFLEDIVEKFKKLGLKDVESDDLKQIEESWYDGN